MLESGVPFAVVATLMGSSAATTARMAKRYGQIGEKAQREAVAVLDQGGAGSRPGSVESPRQVSH